MSIELELHLEGPDANEETLLDLMDWLERSNIADLMVQRKVAPQTKGEMGFWIDPNTIMTLMSTTIAVRQLIATIIQWQKNKTIGINPKLKNPDKESEEINCQIQALLEKLKAHK